MIDDYPSLAVFAALADAGSLSAAGRLLKLSTSVVSPFTTGSAAGRDAVLSLDPVNVADARGRRHLLD